MCPSADVPAATVPPVMAPRVDAPCWDDSGSVCRWVYERTDGNETLSRAADWLLDRPLQIILILLIAWIVARFARRWISRTVHRLVNPDRDAAAKRFRRLGITPPPMLVADVFDPRRETRARVIAAVVAGSAGVLIWTVALITVAGAAGLELGPLIAGAGIAGVALGFGAQNLVRNWIAGLFVLLEDHYGIGDVVDLGQASGVVERFTLRATVLRGFDGTVWHVPNGDVTRAGNLSQLWSVAVLDVEVAYETDLAAAQELLQRTATAVCESAEWSADVLEPPEVLGVEHLGTEWVTLRLNVKTTPGRQWALQRALRAAVKAAFDRSDNLPSDQHGASPE